MVTRCESDDCNKYSPDLSQKTSQYSSETRWEESQRGDDSSKVSTKKNAENSSRNDENLLGNSFSIKDQKRLNFDSNSRFSAKLKSKSERNVSINCRGEDYAAIPSNIEDSIEFSSGDNNFNDNYGSDSYYYYGNNSNNYNNLKMHDEDQFPPHHPQQQQATAAAASSSSRILRDAPDSCFPRSHSRSFRDHMTREMSNSNEHQKNFSNRNQRPNVESFSRSNYADNENDIQMPNGHNAMLHQNCTSRFASNSTLPSNIPIGSNSIFYPNYVVDSTNSLNNPQIFTNRHDEKRLINATQTSMQMQPRFHCLVCGDNANGIHYGILSCEGCKGFFRRVSLSNKMLRCIYSGTCEMTPIMRSKCGACRYKKCLNVGMSLKAIKLGRRTNADKLLMYVSPEAKKNAAKLMTNLRSASNTPKYHHEAHPSDSVSSSQTVDDTLESHACHKSSDKESSLLNERGIDSGCESIIDNNFNYFEAKPDVKASTTCFTKEDESKLEDSFIRSFIREQNNRLDAFGEEKVEINLNIHEIMSFMAKVEEKFIKCFQNSTITIGAEQILNVCREFKHPILDSSPDCDVNGSKLSPKLESRAKEMWQIIIELIKEISNCLKSFIGEFYIKYAANIELKGAEMEKSWQQQYIIEALVLAFLYLIDPIDNRLLLGGNKGLMIEEILSATELCDEMEAESCFLKLMRDVAKKVMIIVPHTECFYGMLMLIADNRDNRDNRRNAIDVMDDDSGCPVNSPGKTSCINLPNQSLSSFELITSNKEQQIGKEINDNDEKRRISSSGDDNPITTIHHILQNSLSHSIDWRIIEGLGGMALKLINNATKKYSLDKTVLNALLEENNRFHHDGESTAILDLMKIDVERLTNLIEKSLF